MSPEPDSTLVPIRSTRSPRPTKKRASSGERPQPAERAGDIGGRLGLPPGSPAPGRQGWALGPGLPRCRCCAGAGAVRAGCWRDAGDIVDGEVTGAGRVALAQQPDQRAGEVRVPLAGGASACSSRAAAVSTTRPAVAPAPGSRRTAGAGGCAREAGEAAVQHDGDGAGGGGAQDCEKGPVRECPVRQPWTGSVVAAVAR